MEQPAKILRLRKKNKTKQKPRWSCFAQRILFSTLMGERDKLIVQQPLCCYPEKEEEEEEESLNAQKLR